MTLKKSFIILLTLCLLLTMQLSVYAEDPLTQDQNSTSGGSSSITVQTKAVNQPEFTISIPESIAPDQPIDRTEEHKTHDIQFQVSVSNLQYLNGQKIQVLLSAPNDSFMLRCDSYELPFQVFRKFTDNTPMTEIPETGGEFALFTEDGDAIGIVRIDSYDIRHAGQYGGSIIFTVQAVEGE